MVILEHGKILEAIKRSRPLEARRAMLYHIENTIRKVKFLEELSQGRDKD
jgi:DNA-binding FadR family transcriptional regulator